MAPDAAERRDRVHPSQKLRLPTNDAWNLAIQHQLQEDLAVEAAYIGNKGTHVFAGSAATTTSTRRRLKASAR